MKETLSEVKDFLARKFKDMTAPRKLIVLLIIFLAFISSLFFLSSCGSLTRATVRNNSTDNTTSITISTSNPSTIDITPNVSLKKSQSYEDEKNAQKNTQKDSVRTK